jgi:uncharacterized protein (DUF433 family)
MTGYTPTEASLLTGLPLTAVRRALEDDAVPSQSVRFGRAVQRVISGEGLLCLKLEHLGVGRFPLAYRKRIYRAVLAQPNIPQLKESEVVVIEVRRARTDLKSAMATYKKAHAMVVEDPEIMGGTPVIRETRVPVHLVAEMRRQGTSVEEVLKGYPTITREQVALAELYAQAHPRRGPKTQTRLPRGARVIARKVYPLKRAS